MSITGATTLQSTSDVTGASTLRDKVTVYSLDVSGNTRFI